MIGWLIALFNFEFDSDLFAVTDCCSQGDGGGQPINP
jgi:hypothetical protein